MTRRQHKKALKTALKTALKKKLREKEKLKSDDRGLGYSYRNTQLTLKLVVTPQACYTTQASTIINKRSWNIFDQILFNMH